MNQIITITGDVGSGKSTVGKLLAAAIGYEHLSTGAMQREIAASRGMTTLELNEASMHDRQVDDSIDSYLQQLNGQGRRLVLDSRMAWHFLHSALKVLVTVDPVVGARRVLSAQRTEESHRGLADAVRNNLRRKALEDERFASLYGVRCGAMANFDVVLDSTCLTPERMAKILLEALGRNEAQPSRPMGYICPKSLYPTRPASEAAGPPTEELLEYMAAEGYDMRWPIEAVRFSHYFFVHDGHKRASCAVRLGLDCVPCILREADETAADGLELGRVVTESLKQPWIGEWESAHGFKYPSCPDFSGSPRLDDCDKDG
jgi:predicted cytidylate kinase